VQYLASIPNPGTTGIPKFLHSDDASLIERWLKAEDRPGYSIYDCPNPLKLGATRHGKDSLLGIIEIFLDIDFRHIAETPEQADEKLQRLLLPPTQLVDSGHGRHPRYRLKELIPCDDPAFERRLCCPGKAYRILRRRFTGAAMVSAQAARHAQFQV